MIIRQSTIILLLALASLFLVSARVVRLNEVIETSHQNEIKEAIDENEDELLDEEEEKIEDEEKNNWIELEDEDEDEDFDASKLRPISFSSNYSNRDLSELSAEEVYNGLPADLGMFPFVVYIQINKRYFCTGILYDKDSVVTAAHCVHPKFFQIYNAQANTIIVRAGSTNRIRGGQTSVVSKYVVHPDFEAQTFSNDVAVLKLKTPFQLNADKYYTDAAKFSSSKLKPKSDYWLAGYGLTTSSDQQEGYPVSLQYGKLAWQKSKVCEDAYSQTKRKIDPKGEFCAGGGKEDMSGCRGDSGGPLVTAKSEKDLMKGKVQVVGMLIYGINCGGPNIFTSLKNNNKVWKFIKKNV